MVDEINDVRIIGVITAVAMMAIALAGLSWESKVSDSFPVFLMIVFSAVHKLRFASIINSVCDHCGLVMSSVDCGS